MDNKRSIRNIRLNRQHKHNIRRKMPSEDIRPKKKGSSLAVFASLFVSVVLLSLLVLVLMPGKATIQLKLKEASVKLSDDIAYAAYKEGVEEDAELYFTTKFEEVSASKSVKANRELYEETRAKGKIYVYNEFSSRPQRIITNTRFETEDGKIYRVRHPFVIPGYKKVNGEIQAGRVEIVVYADEPGQDYNIQKGVKFTLPGLKNDKERYKKIYAVASTDIKGGFKGKRKTISEDTKKSINSDLKSKIRELAYSKFTENLKYGELLFEEAIFLDYQDIDFANQGDEIKATLTAKASAIVFDEDKFARFLLLNNRSDFIVEDDSRLRLINKDDLQFSILSKDDIDIAKDDLIKFTIKGDTRIVWRLDKDSFRKDIAGKDLAFVKKNVIEAYSAIENITSIKLAPMWADRLPEDADNIKIEILNKDLPNQ